MFSLNQWKLENINYYCRLFIHVYFIRILKSALVLSFKNYKARANFYIFFTINIAVQKVLMIYLLQPYFRIYPYFFLLNLSSFYQTRCDISLYCFNTYNFISHFINSCFNVFIFHILCCF